MADPTKYTKGYSFEGYQANNPSKPLPAPRLDDELENIATSIDETIDALKDIRRSDGALKNGIDVSAGLLGGFFKNNPSAVCFSTAAGAVSLNQDIRVSVGGLLRKYLSGATVVLPALSAGTDYAIYACSDGALQASANFSAPAGYTTANSRRIGGFHYAPGGNATGYNTGGGTTPAINPFSLWDLKWRPACPDPRGMALVAGRFWADIYLCGTDVDTNGTSRNAVTIGDGPSPPKVPVMFGGDGTTTYGSFTWFEAAELMASAGKTLLSYDEFVAAAYGTKEAVARGSDAVTTGLGTSNVGSSNTDEKFTSRWGLMQVSGCMHQWGRDFISKLVVPSSPADATALATSINTFAGRANTEGRGSLYLPGSADGIAAALFGASWADGSYAGSRASNWYITPWTSSGHIGARGRSDHLAHV